MTPAGARVVGATVAGMMVDGKALATAEAFAT
jgi:hypothetical protein